MYVKINNVYSTSEVPMYSGEEIIIGIDSSKSNTGICVRDLGGNIKDVIELDGASDGTTEADVLVLCKKERDFLKKIFANAVPKLVGIENIITKANKGKETGITQHESRFKITAVFMSFIFFFQEEFGITPQLINNWSWKAGVLPEEFRKEKYKKGSLAYFKSIQSKYGNYSDDATDAICISEYLCKVNGVELGTRVMGAEVSKKDFSYCITSEFFDFQGIEHVTYVYNRDLTLLQNITYAANRLPSENVIAKFVIPTSVLTFEEIYSFCKGDFPRKAERVKVWVNLSKG